MAFLILFWNAVAVKLAEFNANEKPHSCSIFFFVNKSINLISFRKHALYKSFLTFRKSINESISLFMKKNFVDLSVF